MRWLYAAAAVAGFGTLLATGESAPALHGVEVYAREAFVPNAVTGIYLRNRLYDTLFEVLVFASAVAGVKHLLHTQRPLAGVDFVRDEVGFYICRFAGFIVALVAIELSIRGHLGPGGGFAAGVAGGTALGLVAITHDAHRMHRRFRQGRVEDLERLVVVLFLCTGCALLLGAPAPSGHFGALLSGGLIPPLNVLVALKVTLGAWAIVLYFIRFRGLL